MLNSISVVFIFSALLFGVFFGQIDGVSAAVGSGGLDAVTLMIKLCAGICFWNGVMKIMQNSGLSKYLYCVLKPVIRILFGKKNNEARTQELIAQNMTANLLGLGSAATASGTKAAKLLYERANGKKPHSALLLMIMNTASLQLIPVNVAAIRSSCGSTAPYDILPAVWLASLASVLVGIVTAKLFSRL